MKKTILVLVGLFIAIQFFQIDTTPKKKTTGGDFFSIYSTNDTLKTLIKNACYDCHSYETKYPFYSKIAPLSWFIDDHIVDGRKHLNFSIWNTYSLKRKTKKLEESIEEIEEENMPLNSYLILHSEAKLNEINKEKLIEFFEQILKQETKNKLILQNEEKQNEEK